VIAQLALLPDARTVRRLDLIAMVFLLVYVVLGIVAGVELRNLTQLSTSLFTAGAALDQAARNAGELAQLPLVGQAAGRLSRSIHDTATSVRASAATSSASIQAIAVVLGLAIALIPVLPSALISLPLRLARGRQLRALRRLLRRRVDPEPIVIEQLARPGRGPAAAGRPAPGQRQSLARPGRGPAPSAGGGGAAPAGHRRTGELVRRRMNDTCATGCSHA
jgi:hypothetical protein